MAKKTAKTMHAVLLASRDISSDSLPKSPWRGPKEPGPEGSSDSYTCSLSAPALPQSKDTVETAAAGSADLLGPAVPAPSAPDASGTCAAESNDWESTDDEEQLSGRSHRENREERERASESLPEEDCVDTYRLESSPRGISNSGTTSSRPLPRRKLPGVKARQKRGTWSAASASRARKSAAPVAPAEAALGSLGSLLTRDSQRERRKRAAASEKKQKGLLSELLAKGDDKRRGVGTPRVPGPAPSSSLALGGVADRRRRRRADEEKDFFGETFGGGQDPADIFDRLGISPLDECLRRPESDADSLFLDLKDGWFDSNEESLSLLCDPCEEDDYVFSEGVRDDDLPSLLPSRQAGNDLAFFEALRGAESASSLAAVEREEEEAATYTLVKQMVNTLGVRNWADFLQLQSEYWLFSHAHKQALITATAAERVLQGGHAAAGAATVSDSATEAGAPAEHIPAPRSAQGREPAEVEASGDGGRVQLSAVKMVAACALHQFVRSARILRQLQPRDFDSLSPPLQAYAEEAVRFLASSGTLNR